MTPSFMFSNRTVMNLHLSQYISASKTKMEATEAFTASPLRVCRSDTSN